MLARCTWQPRSMALRRLIDYRASSSTCRSDTGGLDDSGEASSVIPPCHPSDRRGATAQKIVVDQHPRRAHLRRLATAIGTKVAGDGVWAILKFMRRSPKEMDEMKAN